MTIDIHIRIQTTADNSAVVTTGQKLGTCDLKNLDSELVSKINKIKEQAESQLAKEVQSLNYQVVSRSAPLFPVPDRL